MTWKAILILALASMALAMEHGTHWEYETHGDDWDMGSCTLVKS